jgi:hypothetical protein
LEGGFEKKGYYPMPPNDKIAVTNSVSKENSTTRSCIYCGFPNCWKHGTYLRKWFYCLPGSCHSHKGELVQRYICRGPTCERTFSELPEDVLPYCHFYLDSLLRISKELATRLSCYRIAKTVWKISLPVVLRAAALMEKATPWLEGLCREVTGSAAHGFQALITTIREKSSWLGFTRRWFHALYPCRAGTIFNPHNVGIKRF